MESDLDLLNMLEKERIRFVNQIVSAGNAATKMEAEQVRNKIDSEGIVRELVQLAARVDLLDKDSIPAATLKYNILNSLLRKVMPDLKAIEVKTGNPNTSKLVIMMHDDLQVVHEAKRH